MTCPTSLITRPPIEKHCFARFSAFLIRSHNIGGNAVEVIKIEDEERSLLRFLRCGVNNAIDAESGHVVTETSPSQLQREWKHDILGQDAI